MEIVRDLISLGLKITVDGDCSPEIKRHFFAPWRKNPGYLVKDKEHL